MNLIIFPFIQITNNTIIAMCQVLFSEKHLQWKIKKKKQQMETEL